MRRTHSTGNNQLQLKFPMPADIALVDAKFVFDWDLTVSSTNGRTWTLHNTALFKSHFDRYIERHCRVHIEE